jgi:hypothetical protein
MHKLGSGSCQFLPPGGKRSPGYVFDFYFVKNCKIGDKSAATAAGEKN